LLKEGVHDAPLSSLMDSTTSPNVKTMERKKIGVRSLACNTSGGRGACWNSGMGIKKIDKKINCSHGLTQTKQHIG